MSAVKDGVVAVIPVRGLDNGKTRLASSLPLEARGAITRRMLRRVVGAALASATITGVAVVSPDPAALAYATAIDRRVVPLPQVAARPGLNAAADVARQWATDQEAALLVLFGDLPLLTSSDIDELLAASAAVVVGVDRHGAGTNALLLRLDRRHVAADRFVFGFGEGSAVRHLAEARRLGLSSCLVSTPGTAFDLDTAADWQSLLATETGDADEGQGMLAGSRPAEGGHGA